MSTDLQVVARALGVDPVVAALNPGGAPQLRDFYRRKGDEKNMSEARRTLAEWAAMIGGSHNAEAIQAWLSEREGVHLRVWRDTDRSRWDRWIGGWCASLVRPGGSLIASMPHEQIHEAIQAACESFERTERRRVKVEREMAVCRECWERAFPELSPPDRNPRFIDECFLCQAGRGGIMVTATIEFVPKAVGTPKTEKS